VPAGPFKVGELVRVAVSPDSNFVATVARAQNDGGDIYLFDRSTGKMMAAIRGLPDIAEMLQISPDGRYLAAGVESGLRIYDREKQWVETFRDTDYQGFIQGGTFAADGRLAVASSDGKIRLYDRDFKLVVPPQMAENGFSPAALAFTPDGLFLAVGYRNPAKVDLLDGRTLKPLRSPVGLNSWYWGNAGFNAVAWSPDGNTLFAGGRYEENNSVNIVVYDAGRAGHRTMVSGRDTITSLFSLPNADLLVANMDPQLEVLKPDGTSRWRIPRPIAQFNGRGTLGISADGMVVDFGFDWGGASPLRFDVSALKLVPTVPADGRTAPPKQEGLPITGMEYGKPLLDNKAIFSSYVNVRRVRSLAIHPDGKRFVLGTQMSLQALGARGESLWQRPGHGESFAVNITGDGRLVVAAYGDGTIRWYRMDDGRELLALMVLGDKTNWVAWTPEGFYGATPGAFGVLRWHVNHGFDAAADAVPVSAIPRLRRPEALALVLQELETARALGIADMIAARKDVQVATKAAKAPGARLHVLTVGVSGYGDKANDLALKFADRDAEDVASALVNTQGNGLYSEVLPIFLHDDTADKPGIFDAMASMQRNMANDAVQGLAVVMFSGHGTMIDGQFYLVPYGVDDSTPARLKSSAIPASEFQSEIAKLAQHGRVLVLLDACRSGGLMDAQTKTLMPADVLKTAIASSNVTVLTSSTADKLSREDEAWHHGAFTKVLLDALSGSAAADIDTNRDGVISMSELTAYLEKNLSQLTGGEQQLGLDQRFQGDIFVSGL
jgi:WD40 repeat protein